MISLFLLLIFLIRSAGLLLKTSIFRTEAVLELSDGKSIVEIFLVTVPCCPVQYYYGHCRVRAGHPRNVPAGLVSPRGCVSTAGCRRVSSLGFWRVVAGGLRRGS